MTLDFPSDCFFDIEDTALKELFKEGKEVWQVLELLKEYIESKTLGEINSFFPQTAYIENVSKVFIGKNCKIYPGAYIEGPCIIHDHAEIGHSAFIRPYTIVGPYAKVGHASEVKHSVLLEHSKAPHFNYIGDSILGHRVNLGAGVVCANYKINKKDVIIQHGQLRIDTHMKKLGAIIGDDSFIGCNTVLNPGTLIPKGFLCKPCSSLSGTLLDRELLLK